MSNNVKLFPDCQDRVKPVVSADMVRMPMAVHNHVRGIQVLFDKGPQIPSAVSGVNQQSLFAALDQSAADAVVFFDLPDVFADFGVLIVIVFSHEFFLR